LEKEYDEKKVGVAKILKKKKEAYAQQELHKFDKHVRPQKRGENGVGHHYTIC
jgi:hypothetical protein